MDIYIRERRPGLGFNSRVIIQNAIHDPTNYLLWITYYCFDRPDSLQCARRKATSCVPMSCESCEIVCESHRVNRLEVTVPVTVTDSDCDSFKRPIFNHPCLKLCLPFRREPAVSRIPSFVFLSSLFQVVTLTFSRVFFSILAVI
jgi:hypothetical protein